MYRHHLRLRQYLLSQVSQQRDLLMLFQRHRHQSHQNQRFHLGQYPRLRLQHTLRCRR